jgi:hypothetical protein
MEAAVDLVSNSSPLPQHIDNKWRTAGPELFVSPHSPPPLPSWQALMCMHALESHLGRRCWAFLSYCEVRLCFTLTDRSRDLRVQHFFAASRTPPVRPALVSTHD